MLDDNTVTVFETRKYFVKHFVFCKLIGDLLLRKVDWSRLFGRQFRLLLMWLSRMSRLLRSLMVYRCFLRCFCDNRRFWLRDLRLRVSLLSRCLAWLLLGCSLCLWFGLLLGSLLLRFITPSRILLLELLHLHALVSFLHSLSRAPLRSKSASS